MSLRVDTAALKRKLGVEQTNLQLAQERDIRERIKEKQEMGIDAEGFTWVYETPAEVLPARRVMEIVSALRKDFQAAVRTAREGDSLPTDEEIQRQLVDSSDTYRKFAQLNAYKRTFEKIASYKCTRETMREFMDLANARDLVERGVVSEELANNMVMKSAFDEMDLGDAEQVARDIKEGRGDSTSAPKTSRRRVLRKRPTRGSGRKKAPSRARLQQLRERLAKLEEGEGDNHSLDIP